MIQQQRNILQNRTSVTLVGIPARANLFTINLPTSYLKEEDGMTNLRSVVEILYGVTVKVKGQVTLSPLHKVI